MDTHSCDFNTIDVPNNATMSSNLDNLTCLTYSFKDDTLRTSGLTCVIVNRILPSKHTDHAITIELIALIEEPDNGVRHWSVLREPDTFTAETALSLLAKRNEDAAA